MRNRSIVLFSAILCLVAVVFAQDAFKVAPSAYKLQFENDWVKVVRVHYGPKEKVPEHDHPAAATVFVYLNNSGPVRLYHVGGEEPFENIRPPTKAGGFRLAQARAERHEVENLSELPSDFLRVELKTEPLDAKSFDGRFPPEPTSAETGSTQKVAFENAQVRTVRITCAPHQNCDVTASPETPALVVTFDPVRLTVKQQNGSAETLSMETGQTRWLEAGQQAIEENRGNEPVRQLKIEFKTKPMARMER